jgi:glycerol-3-phosphate dehydrogenase
LLKLAQAHSVDVPITQSVAQLLSGQYSAKQAIDNLMSREPRDEYAG